MLRLPCPSPQPVAFSEAVRGKMLCTDERVSSTPPPTIHTPSANTAAPDSASAVPRMFTNRGEEEDQGKKPAMSPLYTFYANYLTWHIVTEELLLISTVVLHELIALGHTIYAIKLK